MVAAGSPANRRVSSPQFASQRPPEFVNLGDAFRHLSGAPGHPALLPHNTPTHKLVSHRHMHLMSVYLFRRHAHLIDVYLIGVSLSRTTHLKGLHFIGLHLIGLHLIGLHLIGLYLTGLHLIRAAPGGGMHLIDVHLAGGVSHKRVSGVHLIEVRCLAKAEGCDN